MKARTRVRLTLDNGTLVIGSAPQPRWFLRWVFKRSARGVGPPICIHDGNGRHLTIEPGTITDVLVATYEGPQPPQRKGCDE